MSNIAKVIEITGERFNQIAPQGMLYDAEKGFAIQILKGNDYLKKIAEKHSESLQQAIVNVAAIGLSLSPAEKLAYLIPRKGKVCLDVSYMGMCRLATNSGSIEWIQAELVYSKDTFAFKGAGEKPDHIFDPFAKEEERGDFRGAYCIAKTKGGDYLTTMMSAEEIYSVRDRSEAYKAYNSKGVTCPWVTDFNPMAKKTVVRRAFNMWPRTDQHQMERMALAVQISNENEGFAPLVNSPDLGQYTDEAKKYFDQLIEKSEALEMYVLQCTCGQAEFTNLYHSFEKGTKGKYQKAIDALTSDGREEFEKYLDAWREAKEIGDDLAIEEMKDEISQEAVKLIEDRL
jgi:recombination protein RecT